MPEQHSLLLIISIVEKAVLVQHPTSHTKREIQLFNFETVFKQFTFKANTIHNKFCLFKICIKDSLDLVVVAQFNAKMQKDTVKNICNSLYC